ncbi:hypothetical protein QBC40DRAFT_20695 [Triangularia verruculosa]|uniref:Uncharacterized protein n=1 Tax=Triangularia verruculosa TaxID=2587418 RepID=A0AAN7AW70_9PEZI|nr:hypothetical protein QBC40DRAFT_20695 [Triangularia verruculosa]
MASTSFTTAVDFNTIAVHAIRYTKCAIAFLQLPTDVAWRRTVSALQAANTATFLAINFYIQWYTNLVLQSVNNSWNAIISSIQAATTAISTGFIAMIDSAKANISLALLDYALGAATKIDSVKASVSVAFDSLVSTATNAMDATRSLVEDRFPASTLELWSGMTKGITMENVNMNGAVLLISSLVWFYLRSCFSIDIQTSTAKGNPGKWRRRFSVAIRELANVLVLGAVLSYAGGYISVPPHWSTTISSTAASIIDRATSLAAMAWERLEPLQAWAGGGDVIKENLGKFAGNCLARLPPLPHWQWQQFIPQNVGIGVAWDRISAILNPIILGPPPPIIANLTSTVMEKLPPTLWEFPFSDSSSGRQMMMPLLTGIIATLDLVMLVRRQNSKAGGLQKPFTGKLQAAVG